MLNLDITMVIPGLRFDGNTINQTGLGGSETAAYYMAFNLAKLGHRVRLFCSIENNGVFDGVHYQPIGEFKSYITSSPHDVLIVQRSPEVFGTQTAAKINILWCHDLALNRGTDVFRGVVWNIDKVFVLSQFMLDQYKEVHSVDDNSVFYKTTNGIDLSLFDGLENIKRDRKKLMYAARPERGLDKLLSLILPKLLKKDPSYTLYIAGYDNQVDHMQGFYNQIDALKAQFGDNVVTLGSLPKRKLYEEYASAGAYVYPLPSPIMENFDEVSCITAMECQAAGLPFISTDRGALPETLGKGAGILIDGDPMSEQYADQFVDAIVNVTTNDVVFSKMSKAGRRHAQSMDWLDVAKKWTGCFEDVIRHNNNDDFRLLRHLYVNSDIVPAKQLIQSGVLNSNGNAKNLISKIDTNYEFMESDDGYRVQYEKIGETHTAESAFNATPHEPRFQWLAGYINQHPEIKTIADYACAHGSYAIHLHNVTGREINGVDIDKHGIRIAKELCGKHANNKEKLSFRTLDDMDQVTGQDCAVVFEVLEHVPEPWTVADNAEAMVKDGGTVLITVPYGPWEYDSYDTYPHRAHIWHLDHHDLFEMFAGKADMTLGTMSFGRSQRTADPIGWYIVTYKKNGKPSNPIDIKRHLEWQRPRQTVSANVLAGPGSEKTLEWSLDSYKDIFDELVIVNTGMGEAGFTAARKHNVKIVGGSDPKKYGFETPRNEGLKHCDMDWVLWIDTDEQITDPQHINKYLRENMYNGYSLTQHHFATDTQFNPDMPVRLFRNRPYNGQNMRWIGMIHEHPELGLNVGPGPTIIITDAAIAHTGYFVESGRKQRFARNYPLLQMDIAKYPERLLQKHFIARDEMLIVRELLIQTGGQVTQEIAQRCQTVIDTYKKHFLGQSHYVGIDTAQYYSEALAVLNKGIDLAFQINVVDPKKPLPPARRLRYESVDDFLIDFEAQTRNETKQFESRYH